MAAAKVKQERDSSKGRRPAVREPFPLPAVVDFGREVCSDLTAAEQREWLVTNGLGSFASGTVAGLAKLLTHPVKGLEKYDELLRTLTDGTPSKSIARWHPWPEIVRGKHA